MLGPQMATDLPAVGARQHQVEQDQIPGALADDRDRLAAIGFTVESIACLLQMHTQGVRDGVIVFDQKQLFVHRARGR